MWIKINHYEGFIRRSDQHKLVSLYPSINCVIVEIFLDRTIISATAFCIVTLNEINKYCYYYQLVINE